VSRNFTSLSGNFVFRKAVALGAAAFFVFGAEQARADGMTGFVAPVAGFVLQTASVESGSRSMLRLDFARLTQNVSLDLRVGAGLSIVDFGGVLKFYQHWYFNSPSQSATGISVGLGAGAMVRTVSAALRDAGTRGYTDLLFHPFARFLYDTGSGWGFFVDLGMDIVPKRMYSSELQGASRTDTTLRNRFFVALGVPFGA
jgi:hypothetical protein